MTLRGRLRTLAKADVLTGHVAFSVLMVVAVGIRVWLGNRIPNPWYVVDEYRYAEYARGYADHGGMFRIPLSFPGLYPHLVAPAWRLFSSPADVYHAVKAGNCVLMSLGVIAFYAWACRLVRPAYALLAAALILTLPPFLYTSMLVTENLFFPAFALALLALGLMLERPTLPRQALVLGAIALAYIARPQALVLLLVLPSAVVLRLLLDRPRLQAVVRGLRPYAPIFLVVIAGAFAYIGLKTAQGVPLRSGLGSYGGIAQAHYGVGESIRWIAFHFAELGLLVAIIPFSAFLLLFSLAWTRDFVTSAAERSFLAVAAAAVFWIVVQVALFSERFAGRIEERNMFHVAPLLILALVLWFERGLPRPHAATALAAVLPLALLLTVPFERFLNLSLLSDTFSLIPFYRLSLRPNGLDQVRPLLAVGGFAAVAIFTTLPRRYVVPVAATAIAAVATLTYAIALNTTASYARNFSAATGTRDKSWIDRAVGRNADVKLLYAGDPEPDRTASVLLQTEFWNRSVRGVYRLAPINLCCLTQTDATVDGRGRIQGVKEPSPAYVAVEQPLELAGDLVAQTGAYSLYRVRLPLRVASRIDGVYSDGWSGPDASYTRFVAPRGPARMRVTLSRETWRGPDVPSTVSVVVRRLGAGTKPLAKQSVVLHRLQRKLVVLAIPPRAFRVDVHVEPTFSPAQFGFGDSRQLGAQVSFVLAEGR